MQDIKIQAQKRMLASRTLGLLCHLIPAAGAYSDVGLVADATGLMIGFIANMQPPNRCPTHLNYVPLLLLHHLTASTGGREHALQLLEVGPTEPLMRAALTWLQSDHFPEHWWMDVARKALFGPGDMSQCTVYASRCW